MSPDASFAGFAGFLEVVPDAMVLVDDEGRIVAVNRQAERLFGYARHEVVGRPMEILIPERYRVAHRQHRSAYLRHPGVRPMGVGLELAAQRRDGSEFPVEISLSPVETDGRTVIMAAIRNIAARQQAEAERTKLLREQAARAEAEAASRLRDEFLWVLSHELRTPLQAMLGWVHLLKHGQLESATARHALEVMLRNVRHQTQLVTDLLDASRLIAGKVTIERSPLDLALVVERALETVRSAAESRGIAISAALAAEAGPVLGDAKRLRQVVWHLLSNAVKFTPEGGRVDIRLEPRGTHARIVVVDNGRGIGRDLLPHVFEHFRQADSSPTRRHGGLGLGLAIARHLVELHGGTIAAESRGEGHGATFIVDLPAARALRVPVVAPHRDPAVSGQHVLAGLRVLVVDDDPDTLEVLETVLEQEGASVTAASSAREAFERLEGERPDVLVSDLAMPGEDGYRLIEKIRQVPVASSIPAVALTAYARPEDREAALRAGYQAHVAKPVEPGELTHEVARLAGRA
jgi:PAS domain S-box-containing protein